MRFLVDMPLSVHTAAWLRQRGHDVIHLREEGLQRLPDDHISLLPHHLPLLHETRMDGHFGIGTTVKCFVDGTERTSGGITTNLPTAALRSVLLLETTDTTP